MISVQTELKYIVSLSKKLVLVFVLYQLARLYFFITNYNLFHEESVADILRGFIVAFIFDANAIVYTNMVFIFLQIMPIPIRSARWYQIICKILFYAVNPLMLIIMISDAEYFRFTHRHATFELVSFMDEFIPLIPAYLISYWFVLPIFVLLIMMIEYFYRKTGLAYKSIEPMKLYSTHMLVQVLIFILAGGLGFLAVRGGFQKYPISPIVAGKYVTPSLVPLVINTPFNIIYSYFHKGLEPVNYFREDQLETYFPFVKQPADNSVHSTSVKQNVMIIVMESFSAEYTFLYPGHPSSTPFLDSISQRSMYFTQMYANGLRSVDGIPAITAGIPANMDESFLSSVYQTNNFLGLPAYLKDMGYSSSFFHGGENGTFNLDNFAFSAGFQKYYGLNEYNGSTSDLSHWGVYDEPFFKFCANKLQKVRQPFISVFFSLSSHHPYKVPENYSKNYPQNENEVLNSVQYADYSLKRFFESVKSEPWFNNTLFIITADHCGPAIYPGSVDKIYRMHVPLVFYHPVDTFFHGRIDNPAQHVDILPTILDYLNYSKPYKSYGSGLFRNGPHYVNLYSGGINYITDGKFLLETFQGKSTGLFKLNSEHKFSTNLLEDSLSIRNMLELKSRAFYQTYINSLINNNMVY